MTIPVEKVDRLRTLAQQVVLAEEKLADVEQGRSVISAPSAAIAVIDAKNAYYAALDAATFLALLKELDELRFLYPGAEAVRQANAKIARQYYDENKVLREKLAAVEQAPIDMVLHCPACGMQHIDKAEWVDDSNPQAAMAQVMGDTWDNPPHRSHLCHSCGHIWRPADVPTNGVAAVKTAGRNDSAIKGRA